MSRSRTRLRQLAVAGAASASLLATALAAPALAGPPDHAKGNPGNPPGLSVDVQLLAFNDYHGHLEPPAYSATGSSDGGVQTRKAVPAENITAQYAPAGGGEYLATHLAKLREGKRNTLTVAAGDLIGGTPFLSGLFHDEPSVESLNAMGLDVSSVGNHEFDEGVDELLRMQNGGCHPVDGCYFPGSPFKGAEFQWLSANVVNESTGKTPLPPYWVKNFQGAKIGFIGMTLEGTPQLVAQAGIRGYQFLDEAETANKAAKELQKKGVESIVVLLHEGGLQTGLYNGCDGISGPIAQIHDNLDPAIDLMITGHTHQPYNCVMKDPAGNDRRVTSAFSFGRIVSEINFTVDKRSGDIKRDTVTATNHIVTRDVAPDAEQSSLIAKWGALANEVGAREVGRITASSNRAALASGAENRSAESSLGNLIADAQLWATRDNGAQIALMNPGGLRANLTYDSPAGTAGQVTYAEAFAVQPFGNLLTTVPMTGDQIRRVLEQQCTTNQSRYLHLGVSEGFTYTVARSATTETNCTGTVISNMRLNGEPINPAGTYYVTVNNFLVDGGDNFTVFREIDPSLRVGAGVDLDAFIAYMAVNNPLTPPAADRVDGN